MHIVYNAHVEVKFNYALNQNICVVFDRCITLKMPISNTPRKTSTAIVLWRELHAIHRMNAMLLQSNLASGKMKSNYRDSNVLKTWRSHIPCSPTETEVMPPKWHVQDRNTEKMDKQWEEESSRKIVCLQSIKVVHIWSPFNSIRA